MAHKKIRMVLYDTDGYMISLVNYLCRKKQEIVETRLFTNISMLQEYVQEGQADVLLVQEEEREGLEGLQCFVPKIILLSEGTMLREHSEDILVYRYQSAEEVVREVLEMVAEDDNIVYGGAATVYRQAEIICGYSPFGGAGLSRFLFRLAKKFAEDYRILCISLEEFHGLDDVSEEKRRQQGETHRGMSEVIFYLQQRKEKLALKLEALVYERGKVDCLSAVESYRDLHQMSREDMECFIQILLVETGYDKFIFDVGHLGEAQEYLLGRSDKIYMPLPKTNVQRMKLHACEQAWKRQENTDILDKICQVSMGEAGIENE